MSQPPPPLCCPPYNTSYDTNVSCIQYKSTSSTDAEKWRSCCCALVVGVSQQYDKLLSLCVRVLKISRKIEFGVLRRGQWEQHENFPKQERESVLIDKSGEPIDFYIEAYPRWNFSAFLNLLNFWSGEVVGTVCKSRERESAQERCGHEKFLLKGGGERGRATKLFFFVAERKHKRRRRWKEDLIPSAQCFLKINLLLNLFLFGCVSQGDEGAAAQPAQWENFSLSYIFFLYFIFYFTKKKTENHVCAENIHSLRFFVPPHPPSLFFDWSPLPPSPVCHWVRA